MHVGHAIIDGVIDTDRTKDWKFEAEDAKISADAVSFPSFSLLPLVIVKDEEMDLYPFLR